MGAEDAQGFDQRVLGAIWHWWVLLLDLLGVEDLLDAILGDLERRFVRLHVGVGSPQLDIV